MSPRRTPSPTARAVFRLTPSIPSSGVAPPPNSVPSMALCKPRRSPQKASSPRYRNGRSAAPLQTMCRELLSIRPSNLVTDFGSTASAERAAHGLLSSAAEEDDHQGNTGDQNVPPVVHCVPPTHNALSGDVRGEHPIEHARVAKRRQIARRELPGAIDRFHGPLPSHRPRRFAQSVQLLALDESEELRVPESRAGRQPLPRAPAIASKSGAARLADVLLQAYITRPPGGSSRRIHSGVEGVTPAKWRVAGTDPSVGERS